MGALFLGILILIGGDRTGALAEMQQETFESPKQAGLAMVYHALGRKADADKILARIIRERAETDAFEIAEVYALRGQSDEAMRWLERARVQRDSSMVQLKGDPPLKSLEADPRFRELLHRMNLPE